ncbi:MAG: guanylate kinase [Planctomycetota bacterium]|nr:MAG: guanylate kinase [Planctomycetota bacterium]
MIAAKPGKLVVISGPSGVGKSTVVRQVIERLGPGIRLSVSATTRPPRPGEQEGVDYYFLSDAEFSRRRQAGEFLECIEVFGRGHWYGTLWTEVRSSLSQGKWVILEIDVDGAGEVLQQFPEAVTIFIRPESVAELERRLRSRGTESEDAVQRRLAVARHELQLSDHYEHQVVNVTVDAAVEEICEILRGHGFRAEKASGFRGQESGFTSQGLGDAGRD